MPSLPAVRIQVHVRAVFLFDFFLGVGGGLGWRASQQNDAVITPIARRIATVPCFYQLFYSKSCADPEGVEQGV